MCLHWQHLMQIHNCLTLEMGVGGERKSAYEQLKAGVHLNPHRHLYSHVFPKSLLWLKTSGNCTGFSVTESIPPVLTTGHALMGMHL